MMNSKYYEDYFTYDLSDGEFLKIAKGIKAFYRGEINSTQLKEIINSTSAKFNKLSLPSPDRFSNPEDIQRIRLGKYLPKEVRGFYISVNDKQYLLRYDLNCLKIIAKNGGQEELEYLKNNETNNLNNKPTSTRR